MAAILVAITLGHIAPASATFVAPKRVYFDEGKRTARLIINNRNDVPMIYTFSWQRRAQDAQGNTIILKDGDPLPANYRPADPYLQFSPRKVIVPPKTSQKIRLLLRRPADMALGEYLSHFYIESKPAIEQDAAPMAGVSGFVQVRTNVAMPVFIRQGATDVNFDVTSASMVQKDGRQYVRVNIENNSTRSLYAKSVLRCTINGEPVEQDAATIRFYTQAKSITRDIKVPKGFNVNSCGNDLVYELYGVDDFEHKKKLLKSISVSR